jgi:hypothetical protein
MTHLLDKVYENIDNSIKAAKIYIGVSVANAAVSTIELNPLAEVNRYGAAFALGAFAIKASDAYRGRRDARQMECEYGEASPQDKQQIRYEEQADLESEWGM